MSLRGEPGVSVGTVGAAEAGLVSVITAGRCPEVASRGPGLQKRRARAPGAQRERATDEGHDPTPEIESSRQAGGTVVRRVKRREMNDNNALDHVAGKEGRKRTADEQKIVKERKDQKKRNQDRTDQEKRGRGKRNQERTDQEKETKGGRKGKTGTGVADQESVKRGTSQRTEKSNDRGLRTLVAC